MKNMILSIRHRALTGLLLLMLCLFLFGELAFGLASRSSAPVQFPANFRWGAATSAHQVEGGNDKNDWYQWEKEGRTKQVSGKAADHYSRFEEDLDLARSINHDSFRLSIEWSRIEPEQGKFSFSEIEHYRKVLVAARERGLKTFVTLHHFTNPLWVARAGGWENPRIRIWFGNFVDHVVPRLGDYVDYWITINEPNVNALTSYVVGVTPPGIKDPRKLAGVLSNFLKAHAVAYRRIHFYFPKAKVGFAHHVRAFTASRWWHPVDHLIRGWIADFWNHQFVRALQTGSIEFSIPFLVDYKEEWSRLKGTLDFIGVNYYTRDFIEFDLSAPQKFLLRPAKTREVSDLGWEIYPQGLYELLLEFGGYGRPLFITENGIADARDSVRARFLCSHLREVAKAIQDGIDVRGYLHWSLIDNFEWIEGFAPRFGFIHVDYPTQKRTIRESGHLFAEIIRSNSLKACQNVLAGGQ
ncbi:MAG: glycoside hydrolase family 1 protein [Bdellovibrionota bacterium]